MLNICPQLVTLLGNRLKKKQHDTFHEWFRSHVEQLVESGQEVPEEIKTLAIGPSLVARSYGSYVSMVIFFVQNHMMKVGLPNAVVWRWFQSCHHPPLEIGYSMASLEKSLS